MQIILENELEKYAWEVMIAAHYKWEKNHGDSLHDQMDWYFNNINKEETEEAVKKEVERRLRDDFDEESFLTEDEYVTAGLKNNGADNMSPDEKSILEEELREEYRDFQKDITEEREKLPEEMRYKLGQIFYTFFNAPENLTVFYKGEVIQSSK